MRFGEGDVAQLPVLLPACATVGTAERTLVHRLVGVCRQRRVGVERAYALCPRVCQKRDAMVAAHAAGLARTRPGRQPSELLLRVEEGLHVAALLRGMQDVGQRELASEGIPKAVVGQHVAVVDLPVVGAVVIRRAVLLNFIEVAGEEVSAEEATVEGAHLLVAAALHSDAVEQGIPRLEASLLRLLQGFVRSEFRPPVLPGLFLADIAAGSPRLHLAARAELEVTAETLALAVPFMRESLLVLPFPCAVVEYWLVKLHDKKAAEVLAMIDETLVVDPARHLPFLLIHMDLRLGGVAVDNQVSVLFLGIRKAKMDTSLSRSHLCSYAVVERDAVVVRLSGLLAMAETRASLIGIDFQVTCFREESIDGIVAYPGRRLVRLTESSDLIRLIKVLKALAIGSRLGRPHVLSKRHSRCWEGVAV